MTRLFDAPSYNAGVEACRGVIAAAQQEIAARFGHLLHQREIGEVFGVLAAELANLRIEPNGEPPAVALAGGPDDPPPSPPLQAMESVVNG
jgi:hypothetical protein